MRAAAEKAIVLDPLLAEAHDALGMVCARDAQWDQSEQSFRRAIKIDPSRPESHGHFALYLLLPLGRIEEALKQVRAAEKAEPSGPYYCRSGPAEEGMGRQSPVKAAGKPVELHVIDAPYGHDCFLLEEARQTPMIRNFLNDGVRS